MDGFIPEWLAAAVDSITVDHEDPVMSCPSEDQCGPESELMCEGGGIRLETDIVLVVAI